MNHSSIKSNNLVLACPTQGKIVLDTNVVLDCLFYQGEIGLRILAICEQQSINIISNTYCLAEFATVLTYPQFKLTPIQQAHLLARYINLVTWMTNINTDISLPKCRDVDDQKFLELAYTNQINWLLSKDKRVLKMKKHKKYYQFNICTPEQWLHLIDHQ